MRVCSASLSAQFRTGFPDDLPGDRIPSSFLTVHPEAPLSAGTTEVLGKVCRESSDSSSPSSRPNRNQSREAVRADETPNG